MEGGAEPTAGIPPWAKWLVVVAIVLVAAFFITGLLGIGHGPGQSGPGQHMTLGG